MRVRKLWTHQGLPARSSATLPSQGLDTGAKQQESSQTLLEERLSVGGQDSRELNFELAPVAIWFFGKHVFVTDVYHQDNLSTVCVLPCVSVCAQAQT